jgi:hypothetical protein
MVNYLVIPNLYKGSALLEISNELEKTIKSNKFNIKIIDSNSIFLTTLNNSELENPDIFMNHSIRTIKKLKNVLKNGDKVLFVDFFQPSLELINYYLIGKKIKVKYGSLFHGASFVESDFFSGFNWLKNFEKGMIDLMDVIYVPSIYTANFFDNRLKNKIKVFPFGFNAKKYSLDLNSQKIYDVIIPHRWSWDKDPIFCDQLTMEMPHIKFAISGYINSKDDKLNEIFKRIISRKNVTNLGIKTGVEHYKNLRKAKVVIAKRDTFGYSFREAMASGCIPVLLNGCCYLEFIPKKYLFNNLQQAKKLINKFVKNYPDDFLYPESFSFKELLEDFYEI